MLNLCRVDLSRRQEVYARIDSYVHRVEASLRPQLVLLFGSFATGDIHEGSDVDIMVVADFKEDFLDRIGLLMELNDVGLPLEPVGYTPQEFERMKESGNSFVLNALEKGRTLFPPRQPVHSRNAQ